jgi:hypothetical protein
MHRAKHLLRAFFLIIPVLFAGNVFAADVDDEVPEVTARVARISFLQGEVQIRRAESEDWEKATHNLPIVEGDEIATERDSRVEIQFDSRTYLRLAENSYIRIANLKDEGIAVSLPQGTLSLRVLEFDKNRAFFEIDAPDTTVAVQEKGMYRVDAGDERSTEVRVSVTEGGEARVYSETSGFTLRTGRSARIYTEGSYAGDWEMADASRYADDFDEWTSDRDDVIAKRLSDSFYDKYYDRDIYGAEDLNDYGEWIHTSSFGYVWRPYRNSISAYNDWSPYRYGHWRWIPPYGWTWVNDEPWGWATYHHGRWVWDNGYWVWSPYSYYRPRRSWWQPALVVLTTINNRVCWYPLPYDRRYNDYNRHHRRNRRNDRRNNTPPVVANPKPTPTPGQNTALLQKNKRMHTPPLKRVPPTGVVAVDISDFGRKTKGYRTAPLDDAQILIGNPADVLAKEPILPTFSDLNKKVSTDILASDAPRAAKTKALVGKTGAADRKTGGAMDGELRRTKIFGNRPRVQTNNTPDVRIDGGETREKRKTGAVVRSGMNDGDDANSKKSQRPVFTPPAENPARSDEDKSNERKSKRRDDNVSKPSPPVYSPPVQQREERRREPPLQNPRREEPKREEPKREQPRYEPPQSKREERRSDPPPAKRDNPPAPKSEPKEERKSSPQAPSESKKGKNGL